MTLSLACITFDCDDPKGLATWWAEAIGSQISNDWGEFVTVDGAPIGVRSLGFGKVPEDKAAKNRVHLDLHTDDRAAEVARLIEHGASHVAEHEVPSLAWTVLLDPAGNEFCIAGPS
ncbi:MAG: VOC family protein [Mycobacteriales bacterium]